MDRNQLIKDYAEMIDNQAEQIKTLNIVLNNVKLILSEALRHPWQKEKEDKLAIEIVTSLAEAAKSRIYNLNKTCTYLRGELADPPPDVQEHVLRKLDLYKISADNYETIIKLEKENEELRKELENYRNFEAAKAKAIQEKQFVSKEEALAQYNLIKARSKRKK
jgi:hypothetical protein